MHFTYRIKHIFLAYSCQVVQAEFSKESTHPRPIYLAIKRKGMKCCFFVQKSNFPIKSLAENLLLSLYSVLFIFCLVYYEYCQL